MIKKLVMLLAFYIAYTYPKSISDIWVVDLHKDIELSVFIYYAGIDESELPIETKTDIKIVKLHEDSSKKVFNMLSSYRYRKRVSSLYQKGKMNKQPHYVIQMYYSNDKETDCITIGKAGEITINNENYHIGVMGKRQSIRLAESLYDYLKDKVE